MRREGTFQRMCTFPKHTWRDAFKIVCRPPLRVYLLAEQQRNYGTDECYAGE